HRKYGVRPGAGEAGANRLLESFDRQPDVEPENVLAAEIVLAEAPQFLRAQVPDENLQLGVDDDDGAAQARQNGLEERGDLIQLIRAYAQLVVHRLQLFVRRL